ncbi:alpha-amylase [Neobacillus notoginsengisoli]|uniref:Sucrose phosphorylase n=1 Tax=Neobacillus notoginsengisoli TaxID=1578198 RepID=A0A417YZ50_9BACI|nr:alpha-amylase family glycosyl hydrolase [Neobacillus notoginsengisoli]RHW42873.1 alpha-amylase [Neobacillus notoginsengisoli]
MTKEKLLQGIADKLKEIYGEDYKGHYFADFQKLVDLWENKKLGTSSPVSEKTTYLITYGDSFYEEGLRPLEVLHKFLVTYVKDGITDIHILPMFPYTSDDGFSVTDYREINPDLGDWDDIKRLSNDYRLMFDFVANHISKSSGWFQEYVKDNPEFENYFIPRDDQFDASGVVRPRTSPLFHEYKGENGTKTAWTTFSEDQVDVNFGHFPVLLEMTDILLDYAQKGATSIRLDAIGFIWKESGTTCMHLPEAHAIIQLWNLILEYFKPNTQIITETNVPHLENISYFGDGTNEAHMVYQFTLPPLVLFTLTTHDPTKLNSWAKTINKVSDKATYFNFLASHDGIGLRPTEGILTDADRQLLVDKVVENGGKISYKNNPDGSQSVYELNINYSDALINKTEDTDEDQQNQKIIAAHAILLSVVGVPAIYYHSLLGSRNDYKGLEESGINRRINREKLELGKLAGELTGSKRRQTIFNSLLDLIAIRKQQSAFSPIASQTVIDLGNKVFALERVNDKTGDSILFILNVDHQETTVHLERKGIDILSGKEVEDKLQLKPYEFVWIKE